MKQSPDNQINTSFIDISIIIAVVFLPHNKTAGKLQSNVLLSTSTRSNRRQPRDNGYTCKSIFTNSWLVRQRHRSWIKGLGKNPQKE